jgi:mRNA (guanine-N7-)-methyltransferase
VLDVGCGKGGDLRKWDIAGTRNYYGVDIAYKAIQDAAERKKRSFKNFCTTFIQQDASIEPDEFFRHFHKEMYFDMASCQFSMHYMFKSEQKVRNFLQNISNRLMKGGYFVCSHPDGNVIIKKLRERHTRDSEGRYVTGNRFYSLITDDLKCSKEKGPFGHPYGFFLADGLVGNQFETTSGEKIIEYVPEYLIVFSKFVEIAKEYGLELQESKNFHEFYSENIGNKKYYDVFRYKIRFDFTGQSPLLMEPELWDVSYLYR